jgi:hypothetical protein
MGSIDSHDRPRSAREDVHWTVRRRSVNRARGALERVTLVVALATCGKSSSQTVAPLEDGGDNGADGESSEDATNGEDGSLPADSAVDDVYVPPVDAAWDGGFGGPLTCTTPGNFKQNWSGQCGVERWSVKTGTDTGASGLSLLPQLTTIAELSSLTMPTNLPSSSRVAPAEKTIYALKDVKLIFARLETDSDYHLVVSDGTRTMITEIPYPGSCTTGSTWQCEISRARAQIDSRLVLALNQGHVENIVVSVIGVGFWDPEHGQYGVAANNIELHPVLAFCFGAGCDPTKD